MANYLTESDITALVASDLDVSGYITRGNEHIESVAYSLGVSPSGIADPIHFMLKEYGRNWVYTELYRDRLGAQNLDSPMADKYLMLVDMYEKQVEKLRQTLTPEIIAGNAYDANHFSAFTSVIYRA